MEVPTALWVLLGASALEDGCDGFTGAEVPADGGYARLPGLAAVAPPEELLVPGFAAAPGSCRVGYLPDPCMHCSSKVIVWQAGPGGYSSRWCKELLEVC